MPRVLGAADITTPLRHAPPGASELGIEVAPRPWRQGRLCGAAGAARRPARRVALYTPHGGVLNYPAGFRLGPAVPLPRARVAGRRPTRDLRERLCARRLPAGIAEPNCPAPVIHNGLTEAEFVPVDAGRRRQRLRVHRRIPPPQGHRLPAGGAGRHEGARRAAGDAGDGRRRPRCGKAQGTDRRNSGLAAASSSRACGRRGKCWRAGAALVVPSLAESLPYVILEGGLRGGGRLSPPMSGGIAEIFGPTRPASLPAGDTPALARAMQAFSTIPAAADREMQHRSRLHPRPVFGRAHGRSDRGAVSASPAARHGGTAAAVALRGDLIQTRQVSVNARFSPRLHYR